MFFGFVNTFLIAIWAINIVVYPKPLKFRFDQAYKIKIMATQLRLTNLELFTASMWKYKL